MSLGLIFFFQFEEREYLNPSHPSTFSFIPPVNTLNSSRCPRLSVFDIFFFLTGKAGGTTTFCSWNNFSPNSYTYFWTRLINSLSTFHLQMSCLLTFWWKFRRPATLWLLLMFWRFTSLHFTHLFYFILICLL